MQFSLIQVVIGAFALIGATVTATWNIRNDRIEELSSRVDAYENSQKWRLPETISKIEQASDHLSKQLEQVLENKNLKDSLDNAIQQLKVKDDEIASVKIEYEKKLDEADLRLKETTSALEQKLEFINNLYNTAEEFSVYEGKSKNLFGLEAVISVTDLMLNEYATMIIRNESIRMYPGNVATIVHNDERCKLLLKHITDYQKADFTFVCDNQSNKRVN